MNKGEYVRSLIATKVRVAGKEYTEVIIREKMSAYINCGTMKAVMVKGVGIGSVTQSTGEVVRHVLCLGYLPHRPVPQPEPSTHNIVPAHHEAMAAVFVATLKEAVVVLYRHTAGPLCISAMYCRSVGS